MESWLRPAFFFGVLMTERTYEIALKIIEKIFHAEPKTFKGFLLNFLVRRVEKYEQKHYPM